MRRGGTRIARASAFWLKPIGFRNSSKRISPGAGLGKCLSFGIGEAFRIPHHILTVAGLDPAIQPLVSNSSAARTCGGWLAGSVAGHGEEVIPLTRLRGRSRCGAA
jgi:hypothetical protein